MAFNSFAAGRKVYGQGSFAPTRGKVNPQGYIQRGLRQQAQKRSVSQTGRDGKSDTRSGIAKRVLAKKKPQVGKVNPTIKTAATVKPLNAWAPQSAPTSTGPDTRGLPLNQAIPNNPASSTPTAGDPVPDFQPIQINQNGTLDLPYDSQSSVELLKQKETANQALLQLQEDEQANELEFSQNTRDTNRQYEDLRRQALNNFGSRGTAFSSGYGKAVGDNANEYNTQIGDINSQRNSFRQFAEKSRMGISTAFNDYVRKDAMDRAARAQEQAGKLGLGPAKPATPGTKAPGGVKAKPKPKPNL